MVQTEAVETQREFAAALMDPDIWRLPPGGHVFLRHLTEGMALAEAADAAAAKTGEFNAAENIAVLLRANVVIGLRRESAAPCLRDGGSR